jgi:hypothetical protein
MSKKVETETVITTPIPEKAIRAQKFQKIKELADWSDALENETLRGLITDLPSGSKIWDLLSTAIGKEVDGVLGNQEAMDSAKESLAKSLENLGQLAGGIGSLATSIRSLNDQINYVNTSEVIRAIGLMIKGGKQPAPVQHQQQIQQQQPQPIQQVQSSGLPSVGNPDSMIENAW